MKSRLDVYDENVQKISDMVSSILPDQTCALGPPRVFEVSRGKAQVWTLFESEAVTIAKSYLEPDTLFSLHQHDAREIIVLYEGTAQYRSGTIVEEMLPGSCIDVSPSTAHSVLAGPEGAWFSVTTVPREEGLGNG
jgi:quercetin dioxygenase-like cupin family protein